MAHRYIVACVLEIGLPFLGLLSMHEANAQPTLPASNDIVIFVEGGEAPRLLALALLEAYKGSALDFEPLTVKDTDTPLQILIRERGWPAITGRDELEATLCDANKHACIAYDSSLKTPSCADLGSQPRENRSLQAPRTYKYRWCLTSGLKQEIQPDCRRLATLNRSVFCAPKVRVEEYTGSRDITVGKRDLVNRELLNQRIGNLNGCSERFGKTSYLKTRCIQLATGALLESLNHGNSKIRISRGELKVPVWGYSIQIDDTPHALQFKTYVDSLRTLQTNHGLPPGGELKNAPKRYEKPSIYQWTERSSANQPILKAQASTFSAKANEEIINQEEAALRVLSRMNFDQQSVANLRAYAFPSIFVLERTGIAPKHFDLNGIRAISARGLEQVSTLKCSPNDAEAFFKANGSTTSTSAAANHATAIAGIISAAKNGKGTVGPLSISGSDPRRIWIAKLALPDFKSRPIMKLSQCAAMLEPSSQFPPIVNISQAVEGPFQAGLQELMLSEEQESSYLFVVASGNTESTTSPTKTELNACTVFPGCYAVGKRNILSVIALNEEANLPSSSSLTGKVFEVAAVGNILGLGVSDTQLHKMSGSSFATPYVTSLAAMVSAAYRSGEGKTHLELSPYEIKRRIISTVDFVPELSKHVLYGRINFTRALDVNSDKLAQTPAGTDPCRQTSANRYAVPSIKTNLKRDGVIEIESGTDAASGAPIAKSKSTVPLTDILRISRECTKASPSPVTFTVLLTESDEEPTRPRYWKNVKFVQDGLVIQKGASQSVSPFVNLVDFTACLRTKSRKC